MFTAVTMSMLLLFYSPLSITIQLYHLLPRDWYKGW